MPRVKRGTIGAKRRKNILKQVKGFRFGRSTKEREASTALLHAGVHAFTGRRDKKGDFRTLWQIKINAGVRPLGLSYSVFICFNMLGGNIAFQWKWYHWTDAPKSI